MWKLNKKILYEKYSISTALNQDYKNKKVLKVSKK